MLRIITILVMVSAYTQAGAAEPIERLKDAVVKIHTTATPADYFTPWRLLNAKQGTGSGSVISGNRILTNAHVVADASYIQAQKNGDPKKYLARVLMISHQSDLALLEVEDKDFFKGLKPLKLGKLPELLQEVSVFGYPFGGNTLSITRGVLSRVEHQHYAHADSYLLAGQIDAAINPGNSGGPVIVDNKIVGVVMQANTSSRAENLGYFVPPSVIRHMLKDAEDGYRHGFVDLGIATQPLDSPAMRASYGVKDDGSGVLVATVYPGAAAAGKIMPNDVVLAINGFDIADDSSILFNKNLRTNFKYALDQYHVGEIVPVRLSRQGTEMTVEINVERGDEQFSLVRSEQFEQEPSYLIYGGVVFVPLNMNLVKRWGRDWLRKAPIDFLSARNQPATAQQQELVVALKVLPSDVNLGYHDWKNWVVNSVNGEAVRDFDHFCRLLEGQQGFVSFQDKSGYQLVVNHQQALDSEAQILERYRIPKSHSEPRCGQQP